MSGTQVLLIEDEPLFRRFVGVHLEELGYRVTHSQDATSGLAAAQKDPPAVVLLDLNLPDLHGLEVLRRLRLHDPRLRVIVITAYGEASMAVAALKAGATDYLTKPVQLDQISRTIQESLLAPSAIGAPEVVGSGRILRPEEDPSGLLAGEHPAWRETLRRVERVAGSGLNSLLLLGESGTGKSAVARVFHELVASGKPFVEVNCPAIPEALFESELFGHEKGAFTGATSFKKGQVELAQGGVLFLDEIGELPLPIQPKLLQFLEQRRFRRVGGLADVDVDVRLVCATNRELRRAVETGAFRQDLYYRLEVVSLELPPLRERGDDVLLLAERFAAEFADSMGRSCPPLTESARQALRAHAFPGNVRELRNLIQRGVAFMEGEVLEARDLEFGGRSLSGTSPRAAGTQQEGIDLEALLNSIEAAYLAQALERADSLAEAGHLLGFDRFAVARRKKRVSPEASAVFERHLPSWAGDLLNGCPSQLPPGGVDLPAMRREIEERAIVFALRASEDNRAQAARLLCMSRASLGRRLNG